jgi:glutamate N-acetyltransferase/amino-acid N-acetyltransferase
MGYSGADFDPYKVDVVVESEKGAVKLVENGMYAKFDEEQATDIMKAPVVIATADIKAGSEKATAWGCDLTYDYVKINADYRS